MNKLKARVTENPRTSTVGSVVLLAAVAALIFGKIDSIVFAELLGVSLLLLGLKDPSWIK